MMERQDIRRVISLCIFIDLITGSLGEKLAPSGKRMGADSQGLENEPITTSYEYVPQIQTHARKSRIDLVNDTVISQLIRGQNDATTNSFMYKTVTFSTQSDQHRAELPIATTVKNSAHSIATQRSNGNDTGHRYSNVDYEIEDQTTVIKTTSSKLMQSQNLTPKPDNNKSTTSVRNLSKNTTYLTTNTTNSSINTTILSKSTTDLSEREGAADKARIPLRVHKHNTKHVQSAGATVLEHGYPRHHVRTPDGVKSHRTKRKHGDGGDENWSRKNIQNYDQRSRSHKGSKPLSEIYGWLIGAGMIILGSLITLTGAILLCYCGDKWTKLRAERRRIEKYGEYERVESVSSLVSSQAPPTAEYCDEPIETVSMI